MAASDHINPAQIDYRITRGLGQARNEIKTAVYAHHPEHGVIGMLSLTNENWNTGRPGTPPPKPEKSGGRGLGVSVIHTDPRYQRQGIGSAMYNIAHRELGYAPQHDVVRTKAGNRFAQSVSGGSDEGGPMKGHIPGGRAAPYPAPEWGTRVGGQGQGEMAKLQAANYEKGEPIDATWARALTPQKPKPNRRKKPVQGELFSGADYEKPKPTAKEIARARLQARKSK